MEESVSFIQKLFAVVVNVKNVPSTNVLASHTDQINMPFPHSCLQNWDQAPSCNGRWTCSSWTEKRTMVSRRDMGKVQKTRGEEKTHCTQDCQKRRAPMRTVETPMVSTTMQKRETTSWTERGENCKWSPKKEEKDDTKPVHTHTRKTSKDCPYSKRTRSIPLQPQNESDKWLPNTPKALSANDLLRTTCDVTSSVLGKVTAK